MAELETIERTSLAAARRRGRLPRRMVIGCAAVLALVGAKGIVRAAPAPVVQHVAATTPAARASTAGFAEAFARAYLTFDPARPEAHAIALAPFLGPDVDVDAGLPVPVEGAQQRVAWTSTVDQRDTDPSRVAVTVAVALEGEAKLRYLAVPVVYDREGRMAVVDYPAAIGAPELGTELAGRDGDDVENADLAGVVDRALENYLADAADNLRADLAPGALVRSPGLDLTLDDVVSLQWAGPGRRRVSAVVVARDARADVAYTLRYDLAVLEKDRWYVAEINPPMARKESTP